MTLHETKLKPLLSLAECQYSLLTLGQMSRGGLTRRDVEHLVEKGWLSKVQRGVYRVAGTAPSWRGSAMAAVLAASYRGTAALSHRSAGALWGLIDPEELEGRLEVTSRRQVRIAGITAHRSLLPDNEVTVRMAIPVTTIERTLLDLGESTGYRRLGELVDEAIRMKLTSPARLRATTDRHRRRGEGRLAVMRQVLSWRGVGYDPGANPWEQEMDRVWERMGLPAAERQQWVRLPGGWRFRPDRVIRRLKLAVEWDGDGHHGRRSDFERDIERRNRFVAAGWTVLDFHSHQSPEEICATVLQVCRRLEEGRVG